MRSFFLSNFLILSAFVAKAEPIPGNVPRLEMGEQAIALKRGDATIFHYNIKPTEEAAEVEPFFSRTGYIHPLMAPSGAIVTGDYAPDHRHQHGLFFAWTKSKFRGEATEFWNQKRELGDVRFVRFHGSGRREGKFWFEVEHHFTSGKDSDEAILSEIWKIEVPQESSQFHSFDITSTQRCATDDPLSIEKYHYGGMAIRGTGQWMPPSESAPPVGKMVTSEGKSREDGNHSRPRWVVMHGPVDGEECGVAVLAHPDNFRAPQWVRLHPVMPYFVFAPMVEEPFEIRPEEAYISRFRYLVFDGKPDLEVIESQWNDFAGVEVTPKAE
ncbi:MAG: PmoA family protein [Verrucomicrobiota bacterium]